MDFQKKLLPRGKGNMTFIIVGINLVMFFFTYLFNDLLFYLSLNGTTFFIYHYYWTIVTHMFIHSSMNHILFNMLALLFVGHVLEESIGSWEFLVYYLLTGCLAGLFSVILYLNMGVNSFLLGASGAIYGVILAFAVFFPQARLYFFGILPIRSTYLILLYTSLNLLPLLLRSNSQTAHLTHLSGFLFGALYIRIRFGLKPIRRLFS
jgi:membrane associated rhomboid family serine protease